MKRLVFIIGILLTAGALVFAGGGKEQKGAAGGATAPGDLKMVLILPGSINDQSWNAANHAGLQKCNTSLGTRMEYVENVQAPDYESTFRSYGGRGYDLIMAAGAQFDDAANQVAAAYPKSVFCVVNGMVSTGPNVAPILPREYEGSYIAGLIAGEVTAKGQFAVIGGFPNDVLEKILDVYEKTAVQTARGRGIAGAGAIRVYANSWEDAAQGRQMAESMISHGADTLFAYAGQVGLGSIQAAADRGVKFIGFSGDQTRIDPKTVVASVVFDVETFYIWAVQAFINGTLAGNTVHEAGIQENIFVPVYTPSISQTIRDRVDAGIKKAAGGQIDFKSMFAKP